MFSVAVAYISDKMGNRGIFLFMLYLLGIIGFSVLLSVNTPGAKYMAVFFCTVGSFPAAAASLTWGLRMQVSSLVEQSPVH